MPFDTSIGVISTSSGEVLSNVLGATSNYARIVLSGTHAGFQGRVFGTSDGTLWFEIPILRETSGLALETYPLVLGTNETRSLVISPQLLNKIKFKAEARTSGSLDVRIDTGQLFPPPITFEVTAPQNAGLNLIDFSSLVPKAAAGRNGAGAITVSGTTVGQRLVMAFGAPTAGGTIEVRIPGTDFESVVSVAGQIQQLSASNLSANTYAFYLAPALT